MKKALKMLLVSLAVAAVSSVALAQDAGVSIGAWGRAVFTPAMSNDGGETVARDGVSWGDNVRTGFTVSGSSDNAGFQVDIHADGGSINAGDQQKIWIKPVDMLTLSFGHNTQIDTLRGNAVYGAWDWLRFNGMLGEDDIFVRAEATDGAAAEVNVAGFHAIVAFDTDADGYDVALGDNPETADVTEEDFELSKEPYTTANMIARGQYQVGYDIAGVGTVRAQYKGMTYQDGDEYTNYGIVNAAVKIDQLVQGLYVDLGVFYPTDEDNTNGDLTKIAAIESYTMGALSFNLVQGIQLDKENVMTREYDENGNMTKAGDEEMAMEIGVGIGYDLGNGLGVTADVRYMNECDSGEKDGGIAALVGVSKGYSNGKIGAGFEISTAGGFANGTEPEDPEDTLWTIPVVAEYWF